MSSTWSRARAGGRAARVVRCSQSWRGHRVPARESALTAGPICRRTAPGCRMRDRSRCASLYEERLAHAVVAVMTHDVIPGFDEVPAPPALSRHVACLWVRVTGDTSAEMYPRILPVGCIDIV